MTDMSDPAAFRDAAAAAPDTLSFTTVAVAHRHHGWTAHRQRLFIAALAETGCVSEACEAAGVSARSAYRLRLRPGAESFAAAWARAQALGVQRLTALAFERAVHGTPRGIYHKGVRVAEERVPSDRLLIYLLKHYDRMRYGNLSASCRTTSPIRSGRRGTSCPRWWTASPTCPSRPMRTATRASTCSGEGRARDARPASPSKPRPLERRARRRIHSTETPRAPRRGATFVTFEGFAASPSLN